MIRAVLPLLAIFLFFLEPVLSLFSPFIYQDVAYTLVPRFVIAHLIFISVFISRKQAITLGLIFGLLYDMFYIDIIGLYVVMYPLICYLAALIIRFFYKNLPTAMLLTWLLIGFLELLSYGFASVIDITTISFSIFAKERLVPTLLANSIFIFLYALFFKYVIERRVIPKLNRL